MRCYNSLLILAQALLPNLAYMKVCIIRTTRLPLFCTAIFAVLLAFSQNVRALSIRDAHELGFVNSDRSSYVNHLVGMAVGTHANSDYYFRPDNNLNAMPQGVLADRVNGSYGRNLSEVIAIPMPGGGPGGAQTPDGGITAMLLGVALGTLGMARRFLMS